MDDIVRQELSMSKLSMVDSPPQCVHALGAIEKSNTGKLRPISDCRQPLGQSINNYMSDTCSKFQFIKLREVMMALDRKSVV